MNHQSDLKLDSEILSLFDYTQNEHAKKVLINLLNKPLSSVAEIINTQEICKGFIANYDVLANYSYTRLYLNEVYFFLSRFPVHEPPLNWLSFQIKFSERERQKKRGKLIQTILLFHRIYSLYLSKIQTQFFPDAYKLKLRSLHDFLASFELGYYESLIRENKLKKEHVVKINNLIIEKIKSQEIERFWDTFFQFEAYLSASIATVKNEYVFPEFSETEFNIQHLYHPLVKNSTLNDIIFRGNVILFTGPNMSGKSTFLKALSLCVYLGHLGLAIPATDARIPFFSYFSIQIDHYDDIKSGYSHFMTELMNLKSVIKKALEKENCFAVFDELFSGTHSLDGAELLETTIRGLSKFKTSLFLISTHLQEFALENTDRVENYYLECEVNEKVLKFTYKVKKGWSNLRVGKILFEKEGLPSMLKIDENPLIS